jgi:hypothetical protein
VRRRRPPLLLSPPLAPPPPRAPLTSFLAHAACSPASSLCSPLPGEMDGWMWVVG